MVFSGAALPAAHCCLKVGPLGPADGAAEGVTFWKALAYQCTVDSECFPHPPHPYLFRCPTRRADWIGCRYAGELWGAVGSAVLSFVVQLYTDGIGAPFHFYRHLLYYPREFGAES